MLGSNFTEAIYPRLPVFLQNIACDYYGKRESQIRFGELFHRRLEELMESEQWSAAEIEAYQNEELQKLVKYAYENVPYYRNRMKSLRLTPQDIRTRDDLVKLPILTKEDVRYNLRSLLSEKASKRDLIFKHTSGTTGKSLHFYAGKAAIAFQWAVWWRHRRRFGLEWGTWHANFTGKLAIPAGQTRPPYWRWSRPMHQVLLNMHHLTSSKIGDILSFLNQHPFEFYTGYPSILHAFVLAGKEAGLHLASPPRIIVTGAENLLDYQYRDIRDYTGSVLTDQYGLSEGCGNASQCSELVYHEDFEFGVMECVDPSPLDSGSKRGKIVCTGFASRDFPFIRYDVGDVATWQDPGKVCPCGRKSTVIVGIDGRRDDYVVTPEGRRIMRFDYVFKDATNVRECQVVQDGIGEIKVRIVKRPSYSSRDEDFIAREIHRWISPQLSIIFEYVVEIERESNGKFRAVKSLLTRRNI